ncbi:MAG: hypothetical protein ACI4F0_02175 [Agathobacter sp.]
MKEIYGKCINSKTAISLIMILVAICSLVTITAYAHNYEIATEMEMKSTIQKENVDGIDFSSDSVYINADLIE